MDMLFLYKHVSTTVWYISIDSLGYQEPGIKCGYKKVYSTPVVSWVWVIRWVGGIRWVDERRNGLVFVHLIHPNPHICLLSVNITYSIRYYVYGIRKLVMY